MFMCVCSMFRPSDFLLFVKNGFVVGVVAKVTASHLLMARPRHCLSATHGWTSLNNSQCSSPTLYTHTQCILSCTAGGKQAARGREGARENRRWEGRRKQGAGGREEAMM